MDAVREKFILHWGEMGARWGINRTVAQIHALLYLSPVPLAADQIAESLSVARSNVSNSLRELQNWGIIKIVHVFGDRRDHFESLKDVWEMFRIVLAERKKREIDPTLAVLQECLKDARREKASKETVDRLEGLLEFFESITSAYESLQHIPTANLKRLARMGQKITTLVGGK